MDDNRSLRMWFQGFLSLCLFVIYLATGRFGVIIVGLVLIPPLSFVLPWLIDSVSVLSAFLIYGTEYSNPSYENRFYQDDMDRAKKLAREGEWNEAIWAYREIARKAPGKYEPRFNLAQVYEMSGHLGLALREYDQLRNLKDKLGPNNVFVRESERAIEELRGTLPRKQV